MKFTLQAFFLILFANNLLGTPQVPDNLIYKGKTYCMHGIQRLPLSFHPEYNRIRAVIYGDSINISTACWRGYYATWEIINQDLFLIEIKICSDNSTVDLQTIFGDDFHSSKVKATWYSGEVECPQDCNDLFKQTVFKFESGKFADRNFYDDSKTKYASMDMDSPNFEEFIFANTNWQNLPAAKDSESIKILVLIETDDEMNIICTQIKNPKKELSLWEKEAIRIMNLVPEWSVIYERGKRVTQTVDVIFRSKDYYQEMIIE